MAKVKTVTLTDVGDALDTPFITPMSKKLIKAAWGGDLKNFVKYLFRFVWFGTRDYTMALIILSFIVAASKDKTPNKYVMGGEPASEKLKNVPESKIGYLFDKIGRGNGGLIKNYLISNDGEWFKNLFEAFLKNHLKFEKDENNEKKNKAINDLWEKFIKQVGKIKEWKRNGEYVKKNLCDAIKTALGGSVASEVEKRLPTFPPPLVSADSSPVLSSTPPISPTSVTPVTPATPVTSATSATSTPPDKESDPSGPPAGQGEQAARSDAEDKKTPIDQINEGKGQKILEERREKNMAYRRKIVELNKKAEGTVKDINTKIPKWIIKKLAGENLPFAAFHLYKERDRRKGVEAEVYLPFPRTSNPDSYKIIKEVIKYNANNPGKLSKNGEDADSPLAGGKLYEVFEVGAGADANQLYAKMADSLGDFFERTALEATGEGNKKASDLKIYTAIETGDNFKLEPTQGLDRYYRSVRKFALNVAYDLLDQKKLTLAPLFVEKNMDTTKDVHFYHLKMDTQDRFLFTTESDENKLKQISMGIFANDGYSGYYKITKPKSFVANKIIDTTETADYLKALPHFLENKNITIMKVDKSEVESKKNSDEKKRIMEEQAKERKKALEEEENDFKEEFRMAGNRAITSPDLAKTVFKKVCKCKPFVKRQVESMMAKLRDDLKQKETTLGFTIAYIGTMLDGFKLSGSWDMNFIRTVCLSIKERMSCAPIICNIKEKAKVLYDALTDEESKEALAFLFTLGFSETEDNVDDAWTRKTGEQSEESYLTINDIKGKLGTKGHKSGCKMLRDRGDCERILLSVLHIKGVEITGNYETDMKDYFKELEKKSDCEYLEEVFKAVYKRRDEIIESSQPSSYSQIYEDLGGDEDWDTASDYVNPDTDERFDGS